MSITYEQNPRFTISSNIVLRSKTPELVQQEFYGMIMAHFAIRGLMHEAALKAGEDPDDLSFLHAVRVIRRKIPSFSAIPPQERNAFHESVLREFSKNVLFRVEVVVTLEASKER